LAIFFGKMALLKVWNAPDFLNSDKSSREIHLNFEFFIGALYKVLFCFNDFSFSLS
jgi:hypothetical protein